VCDEVLVAIALGEALDEAAAAHLRACGHCTGEVALAQSLARGLAAHAAPEPPPGLAARVLRAAAADLARNAQAAAADWGRVGRALAAALLPLPLLVLVDVQVVRAAHAVLSAVLPGALSLYLVGTYGTLLALLFGLTYAAVPVLAARQGRPLLEGRHG
jgi:hypothetical protein